MGKIAVTLSKNVEDALRTYLKEKYGNKRGALSIIVEEAIKRHLQLNL